MVSLRPEWEGIVVPSKFFGSLAAGRPVLFDGPAGSAVAMWIREHQVGWVLSEESMESIAKELRALTVSKARLRDMQQRCRSVYQKEFSKKIVLDRWNHALRDVLAANRADDADVSYEAKDRFLGKGGVAAVADD